MSTLPRQAIRSIRTLHTTSRILSDTPPKSLGFGDYTGRTRSLPTIDIPASSRLNVGGRKNKLNTENKPNTNPKVSAKGGPRQASAALGGRKFPEKREKRTSKSPLVQTSKSLEAKEGQGEGEGNEEFFTMSGDSTGTGSSSRKQMDTVDIDFSPERLSSLKSRTKTRNGHGKGKGGVAAGSTSSSKTGKRDTKGGKSAGSEPAKREDDRSSEGIFGRVSLLFPLRRGARLAEQSIWAEGMKSEDGASLILNV
jgi:hypothetical protein